VNALALELLGVAKEYLGPAAPAFLSRELHAMGVNANNVERTHVLPLAERTRVAASKVMDNKKATAFAQALAQQGRTAEARQPNDHRLASDAAAKLFASGRLRQAETAYRELVAKHGDADSYSGLARTLVSLEDRDAALLTLREGASAFAKKNDRVHAVALLGVAVEIAPSDLAAHRRLAAALANQGDLISACEEYARFIDVSLGQRDTRRAWLELTYGRETLGDLPQLVAIADRVAAAQGGAKPTPPPPVRVAATPSAPARVVAPDRVAAPGVEAPDGVRPPAPVKSATVTQPPAPAPAKRVPDEAAVEAKHRSALAAAVQARTRPEASSAVVLKNAETITHAERSDLTNAAELLARAGLGAATTPTPVTAPVVAQPAPRKVVVFTPRPLAELEAELARQIATGNPAGDAGVAHVRATILIAARDARATQTALDAARRLIALHKMQAAADVLLDLIGAGFRDREAQRLLIEVNCELGRRDTAREKCHLLGAAYRLDGQGAVAEDVERLAAIL
jgi:tetratricopeptide (TPR) repeat protein